MRWLKRLLGLDRSSPPQVRSEQVCDEDAHLRAIVAAAWNSGQSVVGTVDEDGHLTLRYAAEEQVESNEHVS